MPVDTPHPEYLAHRPDWDLIHDLLAGETVVKSRREVYVPKTHKQEELDYRKYLARACLYAATARTHEAIVGFLTKKDPEMPEMPKLEEFLNDADLRGNTFRKYAKDICSDIVASGRGGSIVDFDTEEKRPYVAFYSELDIINWRFTRVGGKTRLTLLVLREAYEDASNGDEFAPVMKFKYHVWRLINGRAEVSYWIGKQEGATAVSGMAAPTIPYTGGDDTNGFTQVETKVPSRAGATLDFIPFAWHVAKGSGASICRPPLIDLAHINISHFRTTADLESGRYVAGQPTPYAIGFDSKDELILGSSFAWVTSNEAAKCGFLEFTGQGLGSLEKALEQKEAQMAAVGARLIELRTGQAEATETVQIRSSAETSALASLGTALTESLSNVLRMAAWWSGVGTTPEENQEDFWIVMNKDFTSARLSEGELTALGQAYQSGNMSFDAYFFNMQRGEMYPDEWTAEDEKDAMEATPPPMIKLAADAQTLEEERLATEREAGGMPAGTKPKPKGKTKPAPAAA